MILRAIAVLFALLCVSSSARAFEIYSMEPADGAQETDPAAPLQVYLDNEFEARTVTRETVQLLDPKGKAVKVVLTPDLGGAITVSPEKPLQPKTKYTLKVSSGLKSKDGEKLEPFEGHFWTGEVRVKNYANEPRLKRTRIDEGEGYVSCAIFRDGHLYVTTWSGQLLRLELDAATGRLKKKETVFEKNGARIVGLCEDPRSTVAAPIAWITYDDNGGESTSPGKFTSSVAQLTFDAAGKLQKERTFIKGLPNGAHPLNSLAFGPDGRLYLAQGSRTHLGGPTPPALFETPLSASILAVTLNHPVFANDGVLNADTSAPNSYDPTAPDAPLQVYAKGVRVAFDFCWHSNKQLYAPINQNDTMAMTPGRDGLSALKNVQPEEALVRVVAGKFYGHPNPAQNKWILMGGNPTAERDAWEVARYPVGTQPESDFDPSLFLKNLAPLGGPSANGCCEVVTDGPLKGRLLICFYTTTRTIHGFTFSPDGKTVTADAPLLGEDGEPLKFGAPLDICTDAKGRMYVTDFQDRRRGDSGQTGGVWMLE